MKKIVLALIILASFIFNGYTQLDCSTLLTNRKAEPPFKMSSLSKSALSISGHIYKYEVPLQGGKEYRLIFLASPVFNNNIHFKVIDKNATPDPSDDKVVIDVPGENPETGNAKGTAALVPYMEGDKEIYPYFDIIAPKATQLEIIIDVKEPKPKKDEYGNTYTEVLKGCIAVVILEKEMEQIGFTQQ